MSQESVVNIPELSSLAICRSPVADKEYMCNEAILKKVSNSLFIDLQKFKFLFQRIFQ